MKKEITHPLVLDKDQQSIVDMHSIMNILNIIVSELYFLQTNTIFDEEMEKALKMTRTFSEDLYEPVSRMKRFFTIDEFIAKHIEHLKKFGDKLEPDLIHFVVASHINLRSIFEIMKVRISEIIERWDNEESWVRHSIGNLRSNLVNVFSAIEKNSKGRYRIVYSEESHDSESYLVELTFESTDGDYIFIPPIIQDVLRDLIANSRKYTNPGGKIRALLSNDGSILNIEVEDTGRGIPENQLDMVVHFGFRADNVLDKQTQGGGFGLTKAYHITKRNGGKMWIESEQGKGTLIKIEIPIPHDIH